MWPCSQDSQLGLFPTPGLLSLVPTQTQAPCLYLGASPAPRALPLRGAGACRCRLGQKCLAVPWSSHWRQSESRRLRRPDQLHRQRPVIPRAVRVLTIKGSGAKAVLSLV